jgi:hypothetical protein
MAKLNDELRREVREDVRPRDDAYERLLARVGRRDRNRRLGAVLLAVALLGGAATGLWRVASNDGRDTSSTGIPAPTSIHRPSITPTPSIVPSASEPTPSGPPSPSPSTTGTGGGIETITEVPIGQVVALAVGVDDIYALRSTGSGYEVRVLDAGTGDTLASRAVDGHGVPVGIGTGFDSLWVTTSLAAGGVQDNDPGVDRLDAVTLEAQAHYSFPDGSASVIGTSTGLVWVMASDAVWTIEPSTGVLSAVSLPDASAVVALSVVDGYAAVAQTGDSSIVSVVEVDGASGAIVQSYSVNPADFGISDPVPSLAVNESGAIALGLVPSQPGDGELIILSDGAEAGSFAVANPWLLAWGSNGPVWAADLEGKDLQAISSVTGVVAESSGWPRIESLVSQGGQAWVVTGSKLSLVSLE